MEISFNKLEGDFQEINRIPHRELLGQGIGKGRQW